MPTLERATVTEKPYYEDDPAILSAIGNICRQWSYLEYLFSIVIWRLLNLDRDTGVIVTGGLDIIPRANMAINLSQHLKADRQLLNVMIAARKSIQDDLSAPRNRAVHGVYSLNSTQPEMFVEVHRGKGGRDKQPIRSESLRSLAAEITAVSTDLREAMAAAGIVVR